MSEYTKHVWPELDRNNQHSESTLEMGILNAEDYEYAKEAVAYCRGIALETLKSINECNRRLAEKRPTLPGEIAE